MTNDEIPAGLKETAVCTEEGKKRDHKGGEVVIFAIVGNLRKKLEITSYDLFGRIGKSFKKSWESAIVDCEHLRD